MGLFLSLSFQTKRVMRSKNILKYAKNKFHTIQNNIHQNLLKDKILKNFKII